MTVSLKTLFKLRYPVMGGLLLWALICLHGVMSGRADSYEQASSTLFECREKMFRVPQPSARDGLFGSSEPVADGTTCVQGVDSFVTAVSRVWPGRKGVSRLDLPSAINLSRIALRNEWHAESLGLAPGLPQRFGGESVEVDPGKVFEGMQIEAPERGKGVAVAHVENQSRQIYSWQIRDAVKSRPGRTLTAEMDRDNFLWFPVRADPRHNCVDGFAPLFLPSAGDAEGRAGRSSATPLK